MEVEFKMFEVMVGVEAEEKVVMVEVQLRPELGAAQVWRQAQEKSLLWWGWNSKITIFCWQRNGIQRLMIWDSTLAEHDAVSCNLARGLPRTGWNKSRPLFPSGLSPTFDHCAFKLLPWSYCQLSQNILIAVCIRMSLLWYFNRCTDVNVSTCVQCIWTFFCNTFRHIVSPTEKNT